MRAEVFRNRDWQATTKAWWYAWHGEPIKDCMLSRFGVAVLDDNDAPLAFAYIYPSSTSSIAWIGFTVRDPFISTYRAGKALKLLLEASEDAVRALGYSVIYTAYQPRALQKLARKLNYKAGSSVHEFIKELV